MKFKLYCKNKGDSDDNMWAETYDKAVEDPEQWGKDTINYFNSTLRPGEDEREFVKVEVLDKKDTAHKWVKRTNGMSVNFRGSIVDMMYCSNCGVTGKRKGLSSTVVRDSKYKAKKYDNCHDVQKMELD